MRSPRFGAKGRAFHYIVGDAGEAAEAKLERMKAEGKIATGDEIQLLTIPWQIKPLVGTGAIPEGSSVDPFAEPPLSYQPPIVANWGEGTGS